MKNVTLTLDGRVIRSDLVSSNLLRTLSAIVQPDTEAEDIQTIAPSNSVNLVMGAVTGIAGGAKFVLLVTSGPIEVILNNMVDPLEVDQCLLLTGAGITSVLVHNPSTTKSVDVSLYSAG